jgi:PAS domain S-box-containing protein
MVEVRQLDRSTLFDTDGHGNFQFLWEDDDRVFCRTWRPGTKGQTEAVLAVLSAKEDPARITLDRLAHEFGLKDELEGAWALRPLALERYRGRPMLVLEDQGGEPLHHLLAAPVEVGSFLRLAIRITAALGKVHQRGLVHKDIKPQNVLVHRPAGEIRLTGFGIASRLARERQAPEAPETIAGTLAYMAPEQTGRMNRSIDSRSDLYALGITLYQMLTGQLPFVASDPMEWVHCHIARRPVAPSERVKEVPGPVSAIIMRLLAKTAEERYQTTIGLESDLRRCLAAWEAQRGIDNFPLGEQDTPDRLRIPEKLYGRARELETLLVSFDRIVNSGGPELVLVSGYSGIGKSSVVNELHRLLVPPRGLFAAGKFDQYKRDIPYATLAQAFQGLVRLLLGKSETELASWRDALLEALGQNGRLMIDLVPELKLIIGDQPPVSGLPPQHAQQRFQLVFRHFIGVFARPEHPLALFLDDLQWLDAATLDLVEDLLTRSDLPNLLLIGAYRDNEVDATHPLRRKLAAIKGAGGSVREITLAPLGREHLRQLIADALHCEPDPAEPVAQLVHEKTGGNPFFAIQLVTSLAEEGVLCFDHDAGRWSCDLDRIHAKAYADNVVDLMVGKLIRLPAETQTALQVLSCIGDAAEITILSIVLEASAEQVKAMFWEAMRHELIEPLKSSYRFIHDRVRESAYSLIPEGRRAAAHLRIGQLLAAHLPPVQREEAVFDIVNQLNRGVALITAPEEREQLAELNLIAGKRAKAATAYASALTYLNAGATLLVEDCWRRQHELVFQLELHRAECEFLTGAPAAEQRLNVLSTRAANTLERATVACLRVDLYTSLDQSSRAIAVGLDYLRHLGIDWSPHPTEDEAKCEYERIWSLLGSRTIEDLIELPLMSDPAILATLDVLTKLGPPSLHTDANLFSLVICRAVNLSLEGGNCDGSCFAYVRLGMVAGPRFGDYQAGFRFGQLGHDLVEQHGLKRFEARTYMCLGAFVLPWTRHIRTGRDLLHRAFQIANKVGDLIYAAYCGDHLTTNVLTAGEPLIEVQREAENGLAFAQKARFGFVINIATTQLALIRTLRGLTVKFGSFDDGQFDELEIERRFACSPDLALAACWYWISKLQARFFAGQYGAAVEAQLRARSRLWTLVSHFETAEYHFYGALSRAALCDSAPADERRQHLEALAAHHKQLQIWAENCPDNFENRAALVGAEVARLEACELAAERLYEQAIRSARANGFIQNEALAYELAARFYAARGFDDIAHLYLRNARYCYARWGADGKVAQLDQSHPQLEHEPPAAGPTSTIGATVEHLDLATVLKVSQAISGEIVLEKLIDTLMRTGIEQAGAERGLLILPRGTEPRIEAEATTCEESIVMRLRDEPLTAAAVPETVIQYVLRTRESVILDDAAAQPPWAAHPYIRERRARSILCLPLITQAKLIGVLYFENNLAPRVFAPARIAVLKLLASQAAIALENAGLYRDLGEREAKIRRLVDANIIGIILWELGGRILEANDAFLRIVGYAREDLVSGRLNWAELTPSEWLDRHERWWIPELKMTGSVQPFEKEYIRKDGSRVPVLVGIASFEESGNHGVSFVLDLTDRKRAEQALRDSEERFRTLVQFSFDVYWESDAQHRFTRQEFAGGLADAPAPDAEIGKTRWEVPYLEPDAETWRKHRETLDAHLPFRDFELARPTPDGGKRYVSVSGLPVFDKAERFIGYRGVSRHVTERKRAEEALRDMQTELAHANRVATMGQLSASTAHEVKQPIGATVTNAQAALRLLGRQPPDLEEARQALAQIVQDGMRAGDIVDGIRALTKKAPSRKERLDINTAIREVIALTSGEAVKNGVLVQTDLANGLPLIEGDRVQLQQVILNLTMNAVEAMSGVSGVARELLLSTRKAEPNGVLVGVCDSGPGLATATLERLFEAFYTTKPGNLGLGLSICRSIIEAHGGRLWASANVPRGATFKFTLPAHPDITSKLDPLARPRHTWFG